MPEDWAEMGLTRIYAPGPAGVYEIIDGNGERYVGSSTDIHRRWRSHLSSLRGGKHPSKTLQAVYSRDGESSLGCHVLEVVANESDLVPREQYWIDKLRPEHNVAAYAGRTGRKRQTVKSLMSSGGYMTLSDSYREELEKYVRLYAEWGKREQEHFGGKAGVITLISLLFRELVREKAEDRNYIARFMDSHAYRLVVRLCYNIVESESEKSASKSDTKTQPGDAA